MIRKLALAAALAAAAILPGAALAAGQPPNASTSGPSLAGTTFVPKHAADTVRRLQTWGCPSTIGASNAICESFSDRWFQWSYYYQLGAYLNYTWAYNHRDFDCWHNSAWTNPDLLARCAQSVYWSQPNAPYGRVAFSSQFNVTHFYWSSQFPSGCAVNPAPTNNAFPTTAGQQAAMYSSHAPPYRCFKLTRVPGDFDEGRNW